MRAHSAVARTIEAILGRVTRGWTTAGCKHRASAHSAVPWTIGTILTVGSFADWLKAGATRWCRSIGTQIAFRVKPRRVTGATVCAVITILADPANAVTAVDQTVTRVARAAAAVLQGIDYAVAAVRQACSAVSAEHTLRVYAR